MARLTKNASVLVLVVLIAFTTSAAAQAGSWYTSPDWNQIEIWLKNGNVAWFVNESPLQFTVIAALEQVVSLQTNHDVWILVKVSKKHTKICHCKGSKQNNKKYININWNRCYKCKIPKKHDSSQSHHHHHKHHSDDQSHHSHSSHSSSSSSSDKKC